MEVTGVDQTSPADNAPLLPDAHCTSEMALPRIQQRLFVSLLLITPLSGVCISDCIVSRDLVSLQYKATFSLPARQLQIYRPEVFSDQLFSIC
jgi:hypothetical protein